MGKFFVAILLCLFVLPVHAATLQGVGDIVHCRPESHTNAVCTTGGGESVNIFVDAICAKEQGELYSLHDTATPATSDIEVSCLCKMTSPYEGRYVLVHDWGNDQLVPENSRLGMCKMECYYECTAVYSGFNCGLDYDTCMDYYPYGSFRDSADIEQYLSALFATEIPQTPCEIGISKLMVSTGGAFKLWAEKYTEPSLVIQYNDQKCYAKLESGAGKLNIKFNGEVYHVVE